VRTSSTKQIDIVLVGAFINPAAVAFYTLAKQITEFVLRPRRPRLFSPNFGEQKAAGELEEARRIYETLVDEHPVALHSAAAGSRSSRDRS